MECRESCLTHALTEWTHGFGRAAQIYVPVHFLPLLVFKAKQIQQSPMGTVMKTTYNAICSSAFLTTYQVNIFLFVDVIYFLNPNKL